MIRFLRSCILVAVLFSVSGCAAWQLRRMDSELADRALPPSDPGRRASLVDLSKRAETKGDEQVKDKETKLAVGFYRVATMASEESASVPAMSTLAIAEKGRRQCTVLGALNDPNARAPRDCALLRVIPVHVGAAEKYRAAEPLLTGLPRNRPDGASLQKLDSLHDGLEQDFWTYIDTAGKVLEPDLPVGVEAYILASWRDIHCKAARISALSDSYSPDAQKHREQLLKRTEALKPKLKVQQVDCDN